MAALISLPASNGALDMASCSPLCDKKAALFWSPASDRAETRRRGLSRCDKLKVQAVGAVQRDIPSFEAKTILPRLTTPLTAPPKRSIRRVSDFGKVEAEYRRLQDLLSKLAVAKSAGERDAILNQDLRVASVFGEPSSQNAGTFKKPAISLALKHCSKHQMYLLKSLVACGQEHLLDTPFSWWDDAQEDSAVAMKADEGKEEVGPKSSLRKAFSAIISMIESWDVNSPSSPSHALPSIMAELDNPGVFPRPVLGIFDLESQAVSDVPDAETLLSDWLRGLESPGVFPSQIMELVDWEGRYGSDVSDDEGLCAAKVRSRTHVSGEDGEGGKRMREGLLVLVTMLGRMERFYDSIGGVIGYQAMCLGLIRDFQAATETEEYSLPANGHKSLVQTSDSARNGAARNQTVRFHSPPGPNLAQDEELATTAAFWGLEALPRMGEIYPLGGAGDRLGLIDELTGECLPVAMLPYCSRTLLEGLIRDLQAREYLHYRVFGERHVTPVAIMTSAAKRNHWRVSSLLQQNNYFGRGASNFRLFEQPLVPTVAAADGHWLAHGPLSPVLKPGGHGAIWKLASDEGVLQWFRSRGREAALVRQISNPLAGADSTLLALSGIGVRGKKKFGFASCNRNVGASEGVNVLVEEQQPDGSWSYHVSCIEYTEFEKLGIADVPAATGSTQASLPANTNVLFVDLGAIESAVQGSSQQQQQQQQQQHSSCSASATTIPSLPGMIMNLKKKVSFVDDDGRDHSVQAGRLECSMQNMADFLHTSLKDRLHLSRVSHSTQSQSHKLHNGAVAADRHTDAVNGAAVAHGSSSSSGNSNSCLSSNSMSGGHTMTSNQTHPSPPSSSPSPSPPADWRLGGPLDTFLVYNDRRKVTSSAKRRRKPSDTNLHQTPDGSFLDLQRNSHQLLTSCGVDVPEMENPQCFVDNGPSFIALFHPALGPLWNVVRQKIRGGRLGYHSEVKLEISELAWTNVQVHGSLLIEADSVMGQLDPQTQVIQYGDRCGRCRLENVTVMNLGVDWSCRENVYWRHSVRRHETMRVLLHGDAEFEARNCMIEGNQVFEVPAGHRMTVSSSPHGGLLVDLQPLSSSPSSPSWHWHFTADDSGALRLDLREGVGERGEKETMGSSGATDTAAE